jgi:hypothetical protein
LFRIVLAFQNKINLKLTVNGINNTKKRRNDEQKEIKKEKFEI